MTEPLTEIVRLAAAGRAVRIGYRRPGTQVPGEYVIEPYRLHRFASGPVVHAWQLSPVPDGPSPWRDFRVDRIDTAVDAERPFEPRIPVTLPTDVGGPPVELPAIPPVARWSDRPIEAAGPDEDYFRYLETAMLDGKVTTDETSLATELGDRVDPSHRKSVHARIYAAVLHEVVADGRISHREEIYLQQVREFLARLGWAP